MKRDYKRPEVLAGVAWGLLAAFVVLETFYGAAALGLIGGAAAKFMAYRNGTLSLRSSLSLGASAGFLGAVVVLVLGTLLLSLLAPDQIEKFNTGNVHLTGDLLLHVWFVTLLLGLLGGALAVVGSVAMWGGITALLAYRAAAEAKETERLRKQQEEAAIKEDLLAEAEAEIAAKRAEAEAEQPLPEPAPSPPPRNA